MCLCILFSSSSRNDSFTLSYFSLPPSLPLSLYFSSMLSFLIFFLFLSFASVFINSVFPLTRYVSNLRNKTIKDSFTSIELNVLFDRKSSDVLIWLKKKTLFVLHRYFKIFFFLLFLLFSLTRKKQKL